MRQSALPSHPAPPPDFAERMWGNKSELQKKEEEAEREVKDIFAQLREV